MGASTSKTPKKIILSKNERASKRILKRNSTIYPSSSVPCKENILLEPPQNDQGDSQEVVLRNSPKNCEASPSSIRNSKKEKKKKKTENAASGDENISTYHQTDVCYYKVENGKFLKLPSNTKHKSNDGSCYVKVSNGSFRHFCDASEISDVKSKEVRQSMPVQKSVEKDKEKNDEKRCRQVMVTMLDGGALPVLAISKRSNSNKKEKLKVKICQPLKPMNECCVRLFSCIPLRVFLFFGEIC